MFMRRKIFLSCKVFKRPRNIILCLLLILKIKESKLYIEQDETAILSNPKPSFVFSFSTLNPVK